MQGETVLENFQKELLQEFVGVQYLKLILKKFLLSFPEEIIRRVLIMKKEFLGVSLTLFNKKFIEKSIQRFWSNP